MYTRVEAGNYAPSVYLALAIARCLDLSVEQLFDAEVAVEPMDATR